MKQSLIMRVAGNRLAKILLKPFLPTTAELLFPSGTRLVLDPRDLRGPSFHLANGWKNPEASLASYEPEQRTALRNALVEAKKKSPNRILVFFDIGANIGLHSFPLKFENPTLQVFAFEPHPDNARCFAATIAANELRGIELVRAALSDSFGAATLFLDESDFGGHSLMAETLVNNRQKNRGVAVEQCTLDDFVEKNKISSVDFLKMDVQGAEEKVLLGAQKTIARFRPTMLIEVQHNQVESGVLLSTLPDGYSVRTLDGKSYSPLEFKKLAQEKYSAGVWCADYLFVA